MTIQFYAFRKYCLSALLMIAMIGSSGSLYGQDCCDQGDKPVTLNLIYTGESCAATNTSQDAGKYECDDFNGGPSGSGSVYIVASENENGGGKVYFSGTVGAGETFSPSATNANDSEFKSKTYFNVYSSQGGTLLQRVNLHTSCSAPLVAGENIGGIFINSIIFKNNVTCGPATPPSPPEDCPVPVIAINSSQGQNNTTVCRDETIIFVTDDPDCSEVTLTWDFGAGATPQTATGPGPHSVTYSSTGTATISLTADNNCDGGVGTTVCPPPPPPPVGSDCCEAIGGKPKTLTVRYTGEGCGATTTSQDPGKYECDNFNGGPNGDPSVYIVVSENETGGGKIYFSGTVAINSSFSPSATNAGDDEFKSKAYFNVYSSQGGTLLQRVNLHTSCSAPLVPGEQIGSILLESAEWKDGSFCDINGGGSGGSGSGGSDCCEDGDKPNELTLTYTGEGCSATNTTQQSGKYECTNIGGGPNGDPSVYIVVNDKEDGSGKVYFSGPVGIDESFTALSANANEDDFGSETFFLVYSSQGGNLLQIVNMHTSCSAPLVPGDQIGSIRLDNVEFKNGVSCGPVTPPGPDCVDCDTTVTIDITIESCLGSIGDFVWNDFDQDGIQDPGEPGVQGVIVQLKDCSNNILETTTTDASGLYLFDELPEGCYRVGVELPQGFEFSPANQGNDALDSDIDPATSMTGDILLDQGEDDLTNDAGINQIPCNINITILEKVCDGKGTVTTEDDTYTVRFVVNGTGTSGAWIGGYDNPYLGSFLFGPQPYGVPVEIGPFPAGAFTPSNIQPPVTFQNGVDINLFIQDAETPTCFDSENIASTGPCSPPPPLGKIGDRVWFDINANGNQDPGEPGIPNVFVMLMDCDGNFLDFQFTDNTGMYMFGGLNAGEYKVFFANPNAAIYMTTLVDAGASDATDNDAPLNGFTDCVVLGQGEINLTIDAGYKPVNDCIGQGGDSDGDGICDNEDCLPLDPFYPAPAGTPCDDGNPDTVDDVVQADECSCEGVPVPVCINVTYGGQIGFGPDCTALEVICGSSGDAPVIGNCASPVGGSGDLEIIWMKNEVGCEPMNATVEQMQNDPSVSNWKIIPGANDLTFDPGTVSTTTCYTRCARRAGCTEFLGESNFVRIEVDPDCVVGAVPDCNNIGFSSGPGTIIVSGLDGAPITGVQVFSDAWQPVYNCFGNCSATENIPVPAGSYFVKVTYADAGWLAICEIMEQVNVSSAALSIDQFSFEAARHEEHVELLWLHNQGKLVSEYVLERSFDGVQFEPVQEVPSKGGVASELYQGYDLEPATGHNYYRIRMNRLDGSVIYSDVEMIHYADLVDFTLFPNPANDFVKVNLETIVGREDVTISVFNNLGVEIKRFDIDKVYSKYHQLDLRDLREGHYIVWLNIPGHKPVAKTLMIGKL